MPAYVSVRENDEPNLDLLIAGSSTINAMYWRKLLMTSRTEGLERDILALFKRACRQGRLDVAEHLLGALETSSDIEMGWKSPNSNSALAEAYREILDPRS